MHDQYRVVLVDIWWYWVWYWMVLGGTGSVEAGTGWYLVVLCQYGAVLVGTLWYWVSIKWYWVSKGLLCLYISKKMEIWSDVTIAGRTNERTNKERWRGWGGWGAEGADQGEVSTIILGMLESSGFRKYSTLLVIQLLFRRLFLFHCLCIFIATKRSPEMRCWRLTCWPRPVLLLWTQLEILAGFQTIPRVPKHRSKPGIPPDTSRRRLNYTTPPALKRPFYYNCKCA